LSTRTCAWALWLLTGMFAFRVAAQPAALTFDGLLPSFDSWDGGVLPYPVVLASQLVILGWLARTAWRERDVCRPSLVFGAGGVLDVATYPALERPGFGLTV
jgi:hypothetical protein